MLKEKSKVKVKLSTCFCITCLLVYWVLLLVREEMRLEGRLPALKVVFLL